MKANNKEFYEMREEFEKCHKRGACVFRGHLERAKPGENPAHIFYDNGTTNQLFHMFMHGYECAQSIAKIEDAVKKYEVV